MAPGVPIVQVDKVVFVVFFAGERARTKIMKICEAFGANRYPFPEEPPKQRQMRSEVSAEPHVLPRSLCTQLRSPMC